MIILSAIILGTIFGFILQRNGVTNNNAILNMLSLRNFELMKKILLGIGASCVILFILSSINLANSEHFSVKNMYWGVILGGAIFGLGWGITGFCPGTALVALGEGNKKAFAFILGGLFGAMAFMFAYEYLEASFIFDQIGKASTIANTQNEKYLPLVEMSSWFVAGTIGICFIIIAKLLPNNSKKNFKW